MIAWGWGFAVAFAVWVAGGVSGAHINPAVTLAFALRRKFHWAKVLPYWGAPVVGCFVGAALVYLVYHDAIYAYNLAAHTPKSSGQALASYSIFATFPAPYFGGSVVGPLIDPDRWHGLPAAVRGGCHRHAEHGGRLEPRPSDHRLRGGGDRDLVRRQRGIRDQPGRDFGPRLFAFFAGWGDVALPGSYTTPGFSFSWYFWIPIVGPLIGGVIGVIVYDLFIGDVLHAGESGPKRSAVPSRSPHRPPRTPNARSAH